MRNFQEHFIWNQNNWDDHFEEAYKPKRGHLEDATVFNRQTHGVFMNYCVHQLLSNF